MHDWDYLVPLRNPCQEHRPWGQQFTVAIASAADSVVVGGPHSHGRLTV
jgi:hypothetical protein